MPPVQLYVYDLSNGMAAQLSQQLTGRYIEGIWHTSIVFHGKEFWYGSGINYSAPGQSHLGRPLRVVELGESGIDEETFIEYINEMRTVYTADKYHLLEFNCNSFTNDCAGFLTGGSIPSYIKDLPTDFLNTPFGASLRPTIDNMYRRPATAQRAPAPATPDALASSILQGIAANAAATGTPTQTNGYTPATQTLTAPIQMCTNPSSFETLKQRHKAVVAFFTSQTCPPCKIVEPVFEELARAKASPSVAFVKIDMSVGMGHQVGQNNGVRATPTFQFYLDGKRVHELKGANAPELRSQTNLLIYDAFPPHPHAKLTLPELRGVSLNPILFSQVPKLDALSTKFLSTVDGVASLSADQKAAIKTVISKQMIPALQSGLSKDAKAPSITSLPSWIATTAQVSQAVSPALLFPLVDLWRLAVLIPDVANHLSTSATSPLPNLLNIAADAASSADTKNLTLTALRLACNMFSNAALTRRMLSQLAYSDGTVPRDILTRLLVPALLSDAPNVRVAAASLAFNVSSFLQKPLMASFQNGMTGQMVPDAVDEVDWVVEVLSAVVEAVRREDTEDSLHRLVTCLGLLVHLSPHLEEMRSLLDVLQTREMLQSKLADKTLVQKVPVRKLIKEIADELCQ
ncbi:hypothetical protein M408DRAFT_17525 [Serendipita vermifera MAFF 305830]|uniref:PPPDE domain-containing protein n=1 Tax=Serendipita vermifera MAFF 305830 TaxID=933852 RepID=A0A0C3AZK7_SERVB|nr:hypothetical protein M408DRAFT_17525 [Serendipita vermifera MAFF 305830]